MSKDGKHSISERRRKQMLECSLLALAKRGYQETVLDDVVKLAKCSHGLFYQYFDGKKEVFVAIEEELNKECYKDYIIDWDSIQKAGGYEGLLMLSETLAKILNGPNEILEYWKILSYDNFSLIGLPTTIDREKNKGIMFNLMKKGQEEGKASDKDPSIIFQTIMDFMYGALQREVFGAQTEKIVYGKDDIMHFFEK